MCENSGGQSSITYLNFLSIVQMLLSPSLWLQRAVVIWGQNVLIRNRLQCQSDAMQTIQVRAVSHIIAAIFQ